MQYAECIIFSIHYFQFLLSDCSLLVLHRVFENSVRTQDKFWCLGTYYYFQFPTANPSQFPEFSPVALAKLRHLTVVSLAAKNKRISYSVLLKELDMENLRVLEVGVMYWIYPPSVEYFSKVVYRGSVHFKWNNSWATLFDRHSGKTRRNWADT